MDIIKTLVGEFGLKQWQAEAAVKLIDEGNTIPFIARYRKEATGAMNDEVLRNFHERLVYLRNLEEKKQQVISSIEEQGKHWKKKPRHTFQKKKVWHRRRRQSAAPAILSLKIFLMRPITEPIYEN